MAQCVPQYFPNMSHDLKVEICLKGTLKPTKAKGLVTQRKKETTNNHFWSKVEFIERNIASIIQTIRLMRNI